MRRIIDQFTNLKVSRQRKWQLRNPEHFEILKKRYGLSDKGIITKLKYEKILRETIESRVYQREYQRDLNYWIRRYLNARSYQDERLNYFVGT